MAKINQNYKKLKENYLFHNIAIKANAFTEKNPQAKLIRMGIGDVTKPLAEPVVSALVKASLEMGDAAMFKGYAPDTGYKFLKESIQKYYQKISNVNIELNEIFISDGAKSDIANMTELFSDDNIILIPDPVYPVYMDSNLMCGRKITLIDGNEQNGFLPLPSKDLNCDIIYLCSPNNPTGAVYTKEHLKIWVDYALQKGAVIFYDAAYEAFISDKTLPRSIYEVEGAKDCAVEFCSLSKTAGFTGLRCSYTVVPQGLKAEGESLLKMWTRRQTTKYNETAYPVQRAAEAVFTPEGIAACQDVIQYYKENARVMAGTLKELGVWFTGGLNSPYIWLKCGMDSWEFFDMLLNKINVVGTPGSGFGKCGEGYFRLTAFNTKENTIEAMARLKSLFKK